MWPPKGQVHFCGKAQDTSSGYWRCMQGLFLCLCTLDMVGSLTSMWFQLVCMQKDIKVSCENIYARASIADVEALTT